MKTHEILDALASKGMKEADVIAWLTSRKKGRLSSCFPYVYLPFRVVYKHGANFDVLPHLDLNRKADVWGFEILSNVFLSKKFGRDENFSHLTLDECKALAEKMFFKGKPCSLVSKKVLKTGWTEKLRDNIRKMDTLLCIHIIDTKNYSATEIDHLGSAPCFDVNDILIPDFLSNGSPETDFSNLDSCFCLQTGYYDSYYRANVFKYVRLAVTCER